MAIFPDTNFIVGLFIENYTWRHYPEFMGIININEMPKTLKKNVIQAINI